MKVEKVLFLGKVIPEHQKEEIQKKTKGTMVTAANAFQWKLINGLDINLDKPVDIINLLPVYSYPRKYADWRIKRNCFAHTPGAKDVNVGFLNIEKLKYLFLYSGINPEIKKWLKHNKAQKGSLVLTYALNSGFLKGLRYVKKHSKNVMTCAVFADLPEFANPSKKLSFLKKLHIRNESKKVYNLLKYVDSFVLLTAQMADFMNITKPFCVVEGISDVRKNENTEGGIKIDKTKKNILYTGTLHEKFGVLNLVNAMKHISDENYRLIICGVGDSEQEIKKASQEDDRIHFLGQVSHEEVLDLQKNVTVLVNPRQNNEEFTKYSFPSKTMEYLATGVPLVAYKLDGIPDEYDEYINYVPDDSLETLAKTLRAVCEMQDDARIKKAEAARNFVFTEKNALVQTRKILDFVKNLS